MVKESAISEWISFIGKPEITMADKDSGFIGSIFQDFPPRNIILQTAIPGHHQSLGATEGRRKLFSGNY